jgi:hypothetical protein
MRSRFGVLFWLLVATIAAPVVIPDGPIVQQAMSLTLFFVMLSGLHAISSHRGELIVGIGLAVPAVILSWAGTGLGLKTAYLLSLVLYLLFFAYLVVLLLLHTLRQHEVDSETIYGAVSVYLLMALVWGLSYIGVAIVNPGSFHFPEADPLSQIQAGRLAPDGQEVPADFEGVDWRVAHEKAQGTLMYYSFVTLTTLGYGDIYPVGDAARILAMLEATLGQLYLVILVARLVGLYTSQETERRKKAPPT